MVDHPEGPDRAHGAGQRGQTGDHPDDGPQHERQEDAAEHAGGDQAPEAQVPEDRARQPGGEQGQRDGADRPSGAQPLRLRIPRERAAQRPDGQGVAQPEHPGEHLHRQDRWLDRQRADGSSDGIKGEQGR